jgi:hypothetical protein
MAEFPSQSHSRAAPERDYVALLSYLPLKSGWSIPRLLLYAIRIRRQLRISAGLVGDVDRPLPLSARNLEPAACYARRAGVQRVRENGERAP